MSEQPVSPLFVSACLVGVRCRFDGRNKTSLAVLAYCRGRPIVPVCPELLGGLAVPRPMSRLLGGDGRAVWRGRARVRSADGADRTSLFRRGAREGLHIARLVGTKEALLKERSPSCGVREVYIDGRRALGVGVFTALLMKEGFVVRSEDDVGGGAAGPPAPSSVPPEETR
jgi:uncharacterized protein YbbK (DUF523 family)